MSIPQSVASAALFGFSSKSAKLVNGVIVRVCVANKDTTNIMTLEDLYCSNIRPRKR